MTDWLAKHREPAAAELEHLHHILLPDQLYRSAPAPITADMRTELYYILEHPQIAGIQQDTNIYAAVGRLQSAHDRQNAASPSPCSIEEVIKAVRQYIDDLLDNEKEIPTIAQIADLYHIDKDHLSKMHKKFHQQQSLQEYISEKRLERAALLLKNGIGIVAVSYRLRYHDISAFSNAFKNKYGVRPSEFPL
ncbi:helix-turn-helix transcriptional regulator [Sphingobacterium faecale]|uniref:Helix-turn-helix transcriptional regulator n=1 Tax=Sphingobacterium faecale TaxID=2803775 RepID=A0ABS1RA61_9SPHI|nr:helix-turn-helix transcriptional regulator [Sphingobacterium faecale]MBL1411582.1 helix-turn-helix transcriptional regulator [Sphingobacterium faecale]